MDFFFVGPRWTCIKAKRRILMTKWEDAKGLSVYDDLEKREENNAQLSLS